MIRKAAIVVLTLAAVAFGTLGTVVGSGCCPWGKMWDNGKPGTAERYVWIGWGANRLLSVSHVKYLDAPSTPWTKQRACLGWVYRTSVLQNVPSGLYFRSHKMVVPFVFLLAFSVVLAAYPVIVFTRGPLRRRRRKRKGLCLTCGYDLTGNESGVCSECGTEIERS